MQKALLLRSVRCSDRADRRRLAEGVLFVEVVVEICLRRHRHTYIRFFSGAWVNFGDYHGRPILLELRCLHIRVVHVLHLDVLL